MQYKLFQSKRQILQPVLAIQSAEPQSGIGPSVPHERVLSPGHSKVIQRKSLLSELNMSPCHDFAVNSVLVTLASLMFRD